MTRTIESIEHEEARGRHEPSVFMRACQSLDARDALIQTADRAAAAVSHARSAQSVACEVQALPRSEGCLGAAGVDSVTSTPASQGPCGQQIVISAPCAHWTIIRAPPRVYGVGCRLKTVLQAYCTSRYFFERSHASPHCHSHSFPPAPRARHATSNYVTVYSVAPRRKCSSGGTLVQRGAHSGDTRWTLPG